MKKELADIRALLLGKQEVATAESKAGPLLFQNEPNPTDGTPLIRYHIPQRASQAQIRLYSVKGEQLNSLPISQKGAGQLSLDTKALPTVVYPYRLFINGKPMPNSPIAQELIPGLLGMGLIYHSQNKKAPIRAVPGLLGRM